MPSILLLQMTVGVLACWLAAVGGVFAAANGLYGGHCVLFEGRRWAIYPKMTDIRWKSVSISG